MATENSLDTIGFSAGLEGLEEFELVDVVRDLLAHLGMMYAPEQFLKQMDDRLRNDGTAIEGLRRLAPMLPPID